MAGLDSASSQEYYFSSEFKEQLLYDDELILQEWAKGNLLTDFDWTKFMIKAYFEGSRFSHVEAYRLCAVGRYWPEFVRHPERRDLVVDLQHMHRYSTGTILPKMFEQWVDIERKEIAVRAADALEIPWEEIENATFE